MNGLTILILAIAVLLAAYLLYGRYLARTWGIDPKARTPAYELEDGVDYVPADTGVVSATSSPPSPAPPPSTGRFRRRCSAGCRCCCGFCWAASFRRGAGLRRHVRLGQEQGPHHRLHHRVLHRQDGQEALSALLLAVFHSGGRRLRGHRGRHLQRLSDGGRRRRDPRSPPMARSPPPP